MEINMRSYRFNVRRHAVAAEVLIQAAEAAIARKGYDRVTMRDIAVQAGCVPGTLYLYFKNKRDVVNALIVRHSNHLRPLVMDAMASTADPLEKLRLGTQKSVEYYNENRSFFKVIFAAAPGGPQEIMAALPARVRRHWLELRQVQVDVIREAQAQGQIRRDFPPETIWKFMHGVISGFLDEMTARDTLPDREEQKRMLWGLLTGGIGATLRAPQGGPERRRRAREKPHAHR